MAVQPCWLRPAAWLYDWPSASGWAGGSGRGLGLAMTDAGCDPGRLRRWQWSAAAKTTGGR